MKRAPLVATLILLLANSVSAQDDSAGSPKDFFNKDFSNEGFGSDSESYPKPTPAPLNEKKPRATPPAIIHKLNKDDESIFEDRISDGSAPTADEIRNRAKNASEGRGILPSMPGQKSTHIAYLGAIIAPYDKAHMTQSLNELLDFIKESKRVKAGEVYIIGNGGKTDQEETRLLASLGIRGMKIERLAELPPRFEKVKNSPTWVLRTSKDEEILLEGVENLREYLTPQGEFTERE